MSNPKCPTCGTRGYSAVSVEPCALCFAEVEEEIRRAQDAVDQAALAGNANSAVVSMGCTPSDSTLINLRFSAQAADPYRAHRTQAEDPYRAHRTRMVMEHGRDYPETGCRVVPQPELDERARTRPVGVDDMSGDDIAPDAYRTTGPRLDIERFTSPRGTTGIIGYWTREKRWARIVDGNLHEEVV